MLDALLDREAELGNDIDTLKAQADEIIHRCERTKVTMQDAVLLNDVIRKMGRLRHELEKLRTQVVRFVERSSPAGR